MSTTMTTYEPCGECGAPLDDQQRYCVECGTSRRHPGDPVARYFAQAASVRSLRAAPVAPGTSVRGRRHVENRWIAVALAMLPVAAAIGVMVGRHGGGGTSDAQLLAALRAQGATGGGAAAQSSTASAAAINSDFSLAKGYVVKLSTLPGKGTTAAAVAKAKSAAKAKGAKAVGVINPSDFVLSPSTGSAYLLYSGQFKTKAQADKALSTLKHRFPGASVVQVKPTASSSGGSAKTAGKITTSAAVATQEHPTAKQKTDGARIVQQIQAAKGKSYVQQQRQLPDTIVVP
ncbi:MAG: hypothetical protein JWM71_1710 [Solirubrobacteraceae bacterium]|nr:hypothetical protein [Solirubrobacteraceae bacterium]